MKSFLGLGVPVISRKKTVIPLWACYCGAAACERVLSLHWNIQRAYMRKTMEIIWRGFFSFFGTKLDIYKSDVPSLHFYVLFFALFCSFLSFRLQLLYDFMPLAIPPCFHLFHFHTYYYFFGPFRRRRSGMPRREHLGEEDSAQQRGWMNDSLPLHLRRAMDVRRVKTDQVKKRAWWNQR